MKSDFQRTVSMRYFLPFLLSAHLGATPVGEPRLQPPAVDLAICLDTSGSMNGLIDSARQSIWAIVNDFALARPAPELRIALLTFGNNGHAAANGWVRVDAEFTEDLDLISQRLFELKTNGGTEYVGRVLQASLERLSWTPRADALKLIVVAGNESADQDRVVPFQTQCRAAIERGIAVNAFYCGKVHDKVVPEWRQVARLADGKFAAIDQTGTVALESPYDAEIHRLSMQLSQTYIPVGASGRAKWANQLVQDRNAAGLNSKAAAQRGLTKSSRNYRCYWDLLDLLDKPGKTLQTIAVKELPAHMQKMTPAERRTYVETRRKDRARVQQQIRELSAKRDAWRTAELARRRRTGSSFESEVRTAIRAQAAAKGLRFGSAVQGQPKGPAQKDVGTRNRRTRRL